MKEIGSRHEMFEGVYRFLHIVELSTFEFGVLQKILDERNLTDEESDQIRWEREFRDNLNRLAIPQMTKNQISRSLRNQTEIYKLDDKLINFDQWANEFRRHFMSKSKAQSLLFGVRGVGKRGYEAVYRALETAA